MPEEQKIIKKLQTEVTPSPIPTQPPAQPFVASTIGNNNVNESDISTDTSFNPIQDAIFFKPLSKKDQTEVVSILKIEENDVINGNDGSQTFKGVSLKDFEYQRKLMEEQNREKRAMLQKAIEKQ